MAKTTRVALSRRGRQILDILYQRGKASAAEVREAMDDAPSYSAVRSLLEVLKKKGHIKRKADGLKYVYMPTVPRERARHLVIQHLLDTYFGGSPEEAMAALLDVSSTKLNQDDLNETAEKGGR